MSGFLHFLSFSSVSAASNSKRLSSLENKFSAASNVWNKIFIGIFLKFNARLRQKRGGAFFGLDEKSRRDRKFQANTKRINLLDLN